MISYYKVTESYPNSIVFDKDDLPRIINALERGLNTLSPPDLELIKVLNEMKEIK